MEIIFRACTDRHNSNEQEANKDFNSSEAMKLQLENLTKKLCSKAKKSCF